jgi:hypothetical protein
MLVQIHFDRNMCHTTQVSELGNLRA